MTSRDCCKIHDHKHGHGNDFDLILHGSIAVILIALLAYAAAPQIPYVGSFAHAVMDLLGTMAWGIIAGMVFIGLMSKMPREYFQVVLGRGDSFGGIIRAAFAGVFLDLCCHGILLVAAKLYERGVSLPQVMAFLIASPWNSFSLTIILISLIGLKWTLLFVLGSVVIAIATGLIYKALLGANMLPANPHKADLPEGFSVKKDLKERLKGFRPNMKFFKDIATSGWREGKMLLRWLLLGVLITAAIRTFVPHDVFSDWFGPTLIGLGLTLVAATIMEVCSEGSAPIAGELLNGAAAPGNAFTFLMAGVSTDYTEILILREMTKSWKIALSLPLVTVPQIVLLGYIMNLAQ